MQHFTQTDSQTQAVDFAGKVVIRENKIRTEPALPSKLQSRYATRGCRNRVAALFKTKRQQTTDFGVVLHNENVTGPMSSYWDYRADLVFAGRLQGLVRRGNIYLDREAWLSQIEGGVLFVPRSSRPCACAARDGRVFFFIVIPLLAAAEMAASRRCLAARSRASA